MSNVQLSPIVWIKLTQSSNVAITCTREGEKKTRSLKKALVTIDVKARMHVKLMKTEIMR